MVNKIIIGLCIGLLLISGCSSLGEPKTTDENYMCRCSGLEEFPIFKQCWKLNYYKEHQVELEKDEMVKKILIHIC